MAGCEVLKEQVINIGGDLDHHADCPIRNPTNTQQIMSRF